LVSIEACVCTVRVDEAGEQARRDGVERTGGRDGEGGGGTRADPRTTASRYHAHMHGGWVQLLSSQSLSVTGPRPSPLPPTPRIAGSWMSSQLQEPPSGREWIAADRARPRPAASPDVALFWNIVSPRQRFDGCVHLHFLNLIRFCFSHLHLQPVATCVAMTVAIPQHSLISDSDTPAIPARPAFRFELPPAWTRPTRELWLIHARLCSDLAHLSVHSALSVRIWTPDRADSAK